MDTREKTSLQGNTKERLIEVALELFAVHGYEGVSTRQIVDKAEVNISAITYYFGGKEGLYKAVIESKIDLFEQRMGSMLDKIANIQNKSKDEQKAILLNIIRNYMDFAFSPGISQYLVLLLTREMSNPTATFELFYDKVIGRMHKTFTRLVATIFDKPEDDEDMILLTSTLIGQILIFRFGKTVMLRRLDRKEYDPEIMEKIKQTILSQIEMTLNNWKG